MMELKLGQKLKFLWARLNRSVSPASTSDPSPYVPKMELSTLHPCSLVDKGSGRVRLPHRLFAASSSTSSPPFRLGELALVYIVSIPNEVFLCTAWPSEISDSSSIDRLIRFPVLQGAPIYSEPLNRTCDAIVYKYQDWKLFQNVKESEKTPIKPKPARSISIRFFGESVKNSHTNTKRLQVRALLESKFIVNKCIISKDRSGGMEIISAQSLAAQSDLADFSSRETDVSSDYPLIVDGSTAIQFVSLSETLSHQISLESRLDTVGGMQDAKKSLMEVLCLPLKYKRQLEAIGTTVPRGILLYGPPGVGKTLLIKEAGRTLGVPVLSISASDVYNPVRGQSELILRQLFEKAENMMGSPSNASTISPPIQLYRPFLYPSAEAVQNPSAPREPSETEFSQSRLDRYSAGGHNAGGVIIFIDEIDAICGKRDSGSGSGNSNQLETRIIAQLLTLLEETRAVVVAATNRPNAIDPALRRPGRFDREIEISLPSASDRVEILSYLLKRVAVDTSTHSNTEEQIKASLSETIATQTQSWSGADLTALVSEACLSAVRRSSSSSVEGVRMSDFESALRKVNPTVQRDFSVEVPHTSWDDIGGLEEVKEKMKMLFEWPVLHAPAFKRLGLDLPRGVLLHGPPGCAKTTLVRAVANACQASFVCLSGAEVYSPFLGEAESKIREIFKKARAARPAIIFFDEIDAMVCKRGSQSDAVSTRVLTQLLTEMDGFESLNDDQTSSGHILVMAATNRPDQLDPALLRPGRFDRIVEIPLPDEETRKAIFKVHTKKMPISPLGQVDTCIDQLSKLTKGCSGADIQAICREAAILALKKDISTETVDVSFFHQSASDFGCRRDDYEPVIDMH